MFPAGIWRSAAVVLALVGGTFAGAQASAGPKIVLTVTDENGIVVPRAEVTLVESGRPAVTLWTDDLGRCPLVLHAAEAYQLRIAKAGFYEMRAEESDPELDRVRAVITHEQMVTQQVEVSASAPGIDPQQIAETMTMNTPEIVNVPFPTNRDIRNLLPFYPGVIADVTGQVHVVGSETWETLDLLDGFDVRSPVSGELAMRVSTDAVRSLEVETTRYPVEDGRATGGVIAYYTGMGDDKSRFNATDFTPGFRELNGIHFDSWVPRETISGPIVKGKAWIFDGLETEYDNIYVPELPANANTDELWRGSNLLKFQVNASPTNSMTGALLVNVYHSPFDGLSALVPQASTTRDNQIAWLPYLRDQQRFGGGTMLDVGVGVVRFSDGYEPHAGGGPYEITPETSEGSYFENATDHSQRVEGTATVYVAPLDWGGRHEVKAGFDLDHVEFGEEVSRAPVSYLREDGTLLRQSVFPAFAPFTRDNAQFGAFVEDRWTPQTSGMWKGLLLEPGVRFDWDEIVRRPEFSPRIAGVYAPPRHATTKISAGVGVYYEHTQLAYLESALAGLRTDTYYAADGVTPVGAPVQTAFTYDQGTLREARALNLSVGLEQKLPWNVFAKVNFIDKHVTDLFAYENATNPGALAGNYVLTNGRQDHDSLEEVEARKTFGHGYAVFAAYTHSEAQTNAALQYQPTVSVFGPQQSGPLPWNAPNRVVSWGWLPFDVPWFRKNWDFVYTLDWHTGFPITSVNADERVVGAVGSERFPEYVSFSPGLEWRFHLKGYYFGLRGVLENATDALDPAVVNNNVSSPAYLQFSSPLGRAFTTRIRLIESK